MSFVDGTPRDGGSTYLADVTATCRGAKRRMRSVRS